MKLSVIIPSYKEPFLQKTLDSFFKASQLGSEVEVIVVIDGAGWLKTPLNLNPRLKVIEVYKNMGMRGSINTGIKHSKGKYILKVDAHCVFCEGFDKLMVASCEENWLMIPRKYSVDDVNWVRGESGYVDYYAIHFPKKTIYGYIMTPDAWNKQSEVAIDDTMSMQGSCWMVNKDYYLKNVRHLDDNVSTYGSFSGDQLELGLKYWLNGGIMKVNKGIWYGHLCKTKQHYHAGIFDRRHKGGPSMKHWVYTTDHWFHDKEPNMKHKFKWLVERFAPVPTWPENREEWQYANNRCG